MKDVQSAGGDILMGESDAIALILKRFEEVKGKAYIDGYLQACCDIIKIMVVSK